MNYYTTTCKQCRHASLKKYLLVSFLFPFDVDSFGCTALSLNLFGTFLNRLDLLEEWFEAMSRTAARCEIEISRVSENGATMMAIDLRSVAIYIGRNFSKSGSIDSAGASKSLDDQLHKNYETSFWMCQIWAGLMGAVCVSY